MTDRERTLKEGKISKARGEKSFRPSLQGPAQTLWREGLLKGMDGARMSFHQTYRITSKGEAELRKLSPKKYIAGRLQ